MMQLLRLGVLTLATLLLLSCGDGGKMRSIMTENTRLKVESARLKEETTTKVRAAVDPLEKEIRALKARLGDHEKSEAEKDGLEKMIINLEREIQEKEAEFNAYKDKYRVSIRSKAKGTSLGDMVYEGTTYVNARISKVDDEGISVAHPGGVAKLDFRKLSRELQNKYAYDPEAAHLARMNKSARAAAAKDRPRTAGYQSARPSTSGSKAVNGLSRAEKIREITRTEAKISGWRVQINEKRARIDANEAAQSRATIFGRSSSATSGNNALRKEISRLQKMISLEEVRLGQMRASL